MGKGWLGQERMSCSSRFCSTRLPKTRVSFGAVELCAVLDCWEGGFNCDLYSLVCSRLIIGLLWFSSLLEKFQLISYSYAKLENLLLRVAQKFAHFSSTDGRIPVRNTRLLPRRSLRVVNLQHSARFVAHSFT